VRVSPGPLPRREKEKGTGRMSKKGVVYREGKPGCSPFCSLPGQFSLILPRGAVFPPRGGGPFHRKREAPLRNRSRARRGGKASACRGEGERQPQARWGVLPGGQGRLTLGGRNSLCISKKEKRPSLLPAPRSRLPFFKGLCFPLPVAWRGEHLFPNGLTRGRACLYRPRGGPCPGRMVGHGRDHRGVPGYRTKLQCRPGSAQGNTLHAQ